jgi:hypothetical protein
LISLGQKAAINALNANPPQSLPARLNAAGVRECNRWQQLEKNK